MIKAFLRTLAATFLGLFLAFVLIIGVEGFSAVVHPFPPDFGGTEEEICRHVERYPQWVLAVVVPLWGLAGLVSTWAARRMGNVYSFAIVGLLLLSALELNLSKLPYPIWFKVANLIVLPAAILAGSRFSRHRKTTATAEVN
jgi:hypothetical protein